MCGAADPSISLSVTRNYKQLLFSSVNFYNCYTGRTIHRIQISESTKSIKILALLDPQIRVEREFPITSFPEKWEKAIFEDYPTGGTNADLFIAIYKRDIIAIKRAIDKGANPNATDVRGFPPLALLSNGREFARRNNKLAEFDKLSEEIATDLFSAGASGYAEDSYGLTLLDYLIGSVPNTVIDMLLANGAKIDKGNPLKKAVMFADLYLTKKFIDMGADINKKGQDRTTALYAASTSAFYEYPGSNDTKIENSIKCIRMLLENGARLKDSVSGQEGLLWRLVRSFGKDQKLKLILTELMPYADRNEIDQAQKLADKMAIEDEGYSDIARWIRLNKNFRKLLKFYRKVIKI